MSASAQPEDGNGPEALGCRECGSTPAAVVTFDAGVSATNKMLTTAAPYCRACGLAKFRAVIELARSYGATAHPTSWFSLAKGQDRYTPADTPQIWLERPGAAPRYPDVIEIPPLPRVDLASAPGTAAGRAPDLSGLDRIDWSTVSAVAYGGAEIPGWLRRLAETDSEPDDEWMWALDELTSLLMQQGDLWDAAAVVMPFLAELPHASSDPVHRATLIGWIWFLAANEAADIAGDADQAAVQNRSPQPAPQSTAARRAAEPEVPGLLATWPQQSPNVRLELARLAALYPAVARPYRDEIASLAASVDGTRQHITLTISLAMIDDHCEQAIQIGRATAEWSKGSCYSGLQAAPGLSLRTRAELALRDAGLNG